MTISNEHPDMSGNILDDPFFCAHCGKEVREADTYGMPGARTVEDTELLFCSGECAEEFVEARGPES